MKDGAYAESLVYSMEDLKVLTEYAYNRGIQVIMELDIPGHAASWTKGKPAIMADCFVKYSYNINDFALNPTMVETFDAISGIVQDIVTATSTTMIHLGGDEVLKQKSVTPELAFRVLKLNRNVLCCRSCMAVGERMLVSHSTCSRTRSAITINFYRCSF